MLPKSLGYFLTGAIVWLALMFPLACGVPTPEPTPGEDGTEEQAATKRIPATEAAAESPAPTPEITNAPTPAPSPETSADPTPVGETESTPEPQAAPQPTRATDPTATAAIVPTPRPTITPTPSPQPGNVAATPTQAAAGPPPTVVAPSGYNGPCLPGLTLSPGNRCKLVTGWIEDLSDPEDPDRYPWNRIFAVSSDGDACYDHYHGFGSTTCYSFGGPGGNLQKEGFEASRNPDGTWTIQSLGEFERPPTPVPTATPEPTVSPKASAEAVISPLKFGSEPGAIHLAAISGDAAEVRRLLEAGADANAEVTLKFDQSSPPSTGVTPMQLAAGWGSNLDVISILESFGASVHASDSYGVPPLHWAAAKNPEPDAVALLIELGADLEAKDDWGFTPLHSAVSNRNPAVAAELVALGADVDAQGDGGLTPCRFARNQNKREHMAVLCP